VRYLFAVPKDEVVAERVIKRYDNRKLYDPQTRRYVTLGDLAGMVAGGLEVRVLDQRSGEDLTSAVLAQVILEGIKERTSSIPRGVLFRLIRLGMRGAEHWGRWSGPQEAAARARSEAERIVEGLIARGRLTLEEALGLRQEIASTVHRLVTEAQQGLEERIRGLLDRTEREGGVNPSLQSFKERLLAFEEYLDDVPRRRGRRVPAPARRGRR
jgi:polyhydroxyalkanoate synthesis repressor PhaR